MAQTHPEVPARPRRSRRLTLLLAFTAGLAVANLYYCQPLLGLMARSFGVPGGSVTQVMTATQLGYAAGLVLLVPLGDRMDRRRIVLWQSVALVAALAVAAVAPGVTMLIVASIAIGIASTIAQHLVPIAAEMADDATRGQTVGTVMSGLLAGILLARVVAGIVAEQFGWRAMYVLGVALALLMALVLQHSLPRGRPGGHASYGQLLASLARLLRAYPELRRASLIQAALFAGFSAFWSTLALFLDAPPFNLGSSVVGLYGLIGLTGVLVAPLAGRLADQRGSGEVVGAGVIIVLAGFVVLGLWSTVIGIGVGVVLLDAGSQLAMISNQSLILALDDAARSRINTIFVTALFLGGALGSAGASVAWHAAGWTGVTAFGGVLAVAALAVQLAPHARR